jgi:uracil-DNA glycosylase family 4
MERSNCPICGSVMVESYGNPDSTMLICGEYPDQHEARRGVPFVGEAGDILASELMRAGIDMFGTCRLTLLWKHFKNSNAECFEYMLKELLKEMAGRKVLLMGSEVCQYFTGSGVMDMAGLEVKSPLFPRSTQFVMIAPSPASVLHTSLGEFRLSVEKYVRKSKEVV